MSSWTAADQLAQEERYATVEYSTLIGLYNYVKAAATGDLFVLRTLEIYIEPRLRSEEVFDAHRLASIDGDAIRAIARELSDLKSYYTSRQTLTNQDPTVDPSLSDYRQLYETVGVLTSNMRSRETVFRSVGGAISPSDYERTSLAGLRVRAYHQLWRVAITVLNSRAREILDSPQTNSDRLLVQLTEDLLAACCTTHSWVSLGIRTKARQAQGAIQNGSSQVWRSHPSLDFKFIYWRNLFILSILTIPESPYEPGRRG